MVLCGCAGPGRWAFRLEHPCPERRFGPAEGVESFPEEEWRRRREARKGPDSVCNGYQARPGRAAWTSANGPWQVYGLTVAESYREKRGRGVLDSLVVSKGDVQVVWHPPSKSAYGSWGGWGWVVHDVNACERDGLVRVDALVGLYPPWPPPKEVSFVRLLLFHIRFVFRPDSAECDGLVMIGDFGYPACLMRYSPTGRLQLIVRQEAAWGIERLFPVPILPFALIRLEKTTRLTELKSVFGKP